MPPADSAENNGDTGRTGSTDRDGPMPIISTRVAPRRPSVTGWLVAGLAMVSSAARGDDAAPTLPGVPDAAIAAPTEIGISEGVAAPPEGATVAWQGGAPILADALSTDPRRYLVFDVLGMQRDYHVPDGPLVVENVTPTFTALQTNMLQSTVAPGTRILYGDYGADGVGWEAGYLGLWNMFAVSRVESADGLLQAPGELGFASPALRNATQGSFSGVTALQSADVNAVFHTFDGGRDPLSPRPSQRVSWYDGGHIDLLAGFRWAGLEDAGVLGLVPSGAPEANTYATRQTTNLFAGQVGIRGRMEFQEWALESWIKCGLAGTSINRSQSFYDQTAPLDPYRSAGSSWTSGMGLIADANLSAIWRMNEVWGVRLGYNLVWLTGVALAPDQFDWSESTAASTGIVHDASMLLSGANVGLEARW